MAMKDQEVVIEAKKTDGCILEVVLPQIIASSTHTVVLVVEVPPLRAYLI